MAEPGCAWQQEAQGRRRQTVPQETREAQACGQPVWRPGENDAEWDHYWARVEASHSAGSAVSGGDGSLRGTLAAGVSLALPWAAAAVLAWSLLDYISLAAHAWIDERLTALFRALGAMVPAFPF